MNNTNNETNKKTTAPQNSSMTKFLCLIIGAIILVAAVAVTVFLITRDNGNDTEYLPKDYGSDPSGNDDDYTARY